MQIFSKEKYARLSKGWLGRLKVAYKRMTTAKMVNPEMNFLVEAPILGCKHCYDAGEMFSPLLVSFLDNKVIARCQRCQRIVFSRVSSKEVLLTHNHNAIITGP